MRTFLVPLLSVTVSLYLIGCDLDEDCNEAGVCADGGGQGGQGGGAGGQGGGAGGQGGAGNIGGPGGQGGGAGGQGGGAGGQGGGGPNLDEECAGTCEVAADCAAESEACGNVVDAASQSAYEDACFQACTSRSFSFAEADATDTCEEEIAVVNAGSAAAAAACGGGGGNGFPVNGPCSLDEPDGDGETEGACIDDNVCEGFTTAGLCDGGANIQCCTSHPCFLDDGSEGVCKATNACAGSSSAGACPGGGAIQCCVE